MKTEVMVVAAGLGRRLNAKGPKALVLLKGKPLIAYCLKVFENHPGIDGVVIVGAGGFLSQFIRLTRSFKKVRAVVAGGLLRSDSVKCGLKALSSDTDIVLVHDAARPFVEKDMISRLFAALKKNKAAIVGVPVKVRWKSGSLRRPIGFQNRAAAIQCCLATAGRAYQRSNSRQWCGKTLMRSRVFWE